MTPHCLNCDSLTLMNIQKNLHLKPSTCNGAIDIDSITKTYKNHINIKKIKEHLPEIVPDNFHFNLVTMDEVQIGVLKLNKKKSSASGTIPTTVLKQTVEVHLQFLTNATNHGLQKTYFLIN